MARRPLLRLVTFASLMSLALTSDPGVPFQLTPSNRSYGPDGPWQAVNVLIGENQDSIDLFPGGSATVLFAKTQCSHKSDCGAGGTFDRNSSESYVSLQDDEDVPPGDWVLGLLNFSGIVENGLDELTLVSPSDSVEDVYASNFSIAIYDNILLTIGDGVPYPLQAGQLALNPPPGNGSLSTEIEGNGTLIPGNLETQGLIPSASFGLHYGSVALKQNLSCWLGGYDQQRLVGPVSSQEPVNSEIDYMANMQIDLFDIGIGVENGGSPFPFASKQGLLAANNASVGDWLPVVMDPFLPFLALPNSTCNAIASTLPVTYNSTLGLYLWDTTSPAYQHITTSPSYLAFTFRLSLSSTANFTINVPFSLLNLNLEPPLVSKSMPYFPCQAPPQFDKSYSLGRAFLQAAFIGGNWDPDVNKWYLAQAPGPNIATQPIPVAMTSDSVVNSSSNAWADTWKGAWTPLPSKSGAAAASSGTGLPPPSNRLSGGAIAGIVIGVLLALGLLAAGAALVFLRRRRRQRGGVIKSRDETSLSPYQDQMEKLASPLSDSSRPEFKQEIGGVAVHEMGGSGGEEQGRGLGLGELEGTSKAGSPQPDRASLDEGGESEEREGLAVGEEEGVRLRDSGVSPRLDVDLEDTGGSFTEGLMARGSTRSSRRVSAL